MADRIVIIQFNYDMNDEDVANDAKSLAQAVRDVGGLKWKLWLHNPGAKAAGGVYCFASRKAAEAYIDGPIVKEIETHPAFFSMTIRQYDSMPEPGEMTRSPAD